MGVENMGNVGSEGTAGLSTTKFGMVLHLAGTHRFSLTVGEAGALLEQTFTTLHDLLHGDHDEPTHEHCGICGEPVVEGSPDRTTDVEAGAVHAHHYDEEEA